MSAAKRTVARAAAVLLAAGLVACADARLEAGRRLFTGEEALSARLGAQGAALPVDASRCVNCHGEGPAAEPVAAATTASGVVAERALPAPPLTRERLTQALPRLNGPAVAYDEAAFCRTLATGVTPNHITLSRTMPRYEPTPAQCQALWAYVSTRRAP